MNLDGRKRKAHELWASNSDENQRYQKAKSPAVRRGLIQFNVVHLSEI
jgi:hypothetical protein